MGWEARTETETADASTAPVHAIAVQGQDATPIWQSSGTEAAIPPKRPEPQGRG